MKHLRFIYCLTYLLGSCDSEEETNLPPTDFAVSAEFITKNSAQLIWTQATDPDDDLVSYEVRLQGTSLTNNLQGDRYELLNLNSDTEYMAEVIAVDAKGSESLASTTFRTPGNLPPSDFVVSAQLVTKNSARINWTQATDPDGDSISYEVRLQGITIASRIPNITYKFLNLNPGGEYTAEVIAIDLEGNQTLKSLTFKTPLKNIFKGDVWLKFRAQVIEFGLNEYDEIHGSLKIGGGCQTLEDDCSPTSITDLSPLKSITRITSYLILTWNTPVINLDGISNLEEVGGLIIDLVTINENTKAFNKIDSIKGDVRLRLPWNSSAGGLNNLTYVGGQFIFEASNASQLTEFQNLTYLGRCTIKDAGYLTDLNALSKLQHVNGNLLIWRNSKLTDLCGLNTLVSGNGITGTYTVTENAYNPTLADLTNGNCKK
jgi:hypothetical protein